MSNQHLILVHGRATKPPKAAKRRLVKKALVEGLKRVDTKAVACGRVKFTLAYYGDINNRLMIAAEPGRKRKIVKIGDDWYEPLHSYDEDLDRFLRHPTSRHSLRDYKRLLRGWTTSASRTTSRGSPVRP